ncbi:sensor histidine kinase [Saccharicrinis sp. FJH62]|uniref:sensor histidine kinase n=1 Tax=Saccharicrinis sp. FJH62 TaxID=3344657 RepID=UPI0035D45BE9
MAVEFSPGKNDPIKDFLNETNSLENIANLKELLGTLSYIIFILNRNKEIVFSNDNLLAKFKIVNNKDIHGYKPGEIFACIHANQGPAGCGSSEFCRYCSVVNSILETHATNVINTREARVIVDNNGLEEQLDLEITATPFRFAGNNYTVFSAQDITDKKRKEILERTFFHDIINMAGSLDGIMELMEEMSCHEKDRLLITAKRISNTLIDEIMAQYQISKAEHNELTVNPGEFNINSLILDAIDNISHHHVATKKIIHYNPTLINQTIVTDKILFNRILINMMKNALEASNSNETIWIDLSKNDSEFNITVNNKHFMPVHIQQQIFQRSFSTKGSGRGIGTYSMKLLGERYLKGSVSFISNQENGTTFSFSIPKSIRQN